MCVSISVLFAWCIVFCCTDVLCFFFLFIHSLSGIKGVTLFDYDDYASKHICGDMCFQFYGVDI